MKPTVEEILQHIYDSEIHFSFGWMWDGGIDYAIGRDLSYLSTGEVSPSGYSNISDAMDKIASEIHREYPNSKFAKWWSGAHEFHHGCYLFLGPGETPKEPNYCVMDHQQYCNYGPPTGSKKEQCKHWRRVEG